MFAVLRRHLLPTSILVTVLVGVILLLYLSFGLPAQLERSPWMLNNKAALNEFLSDTLNMPVQVGQFQVVAGGDLRLKDVKVSAQAPQAHLVAEVESVTLDLSLWRLFRRGNVLDAIAGVHVRGIRAEIGGEGSDLAQILPAQTKKSASIESLPFPIFLYDVAAKWDGFSWHEQQLVVRQAEAGAQLRLTQSEVRRDELVFAIKGTAVLMSGQVAGLDLDIGTPLGLFKASGVIGTTGNGSLDIDLTGTNIQVPQHFGPLDTTPVTAAAHLSGDFGEPQFDLSVQQGESELSTVGAYSDGKIQIHFSQLQRPQGIYEAEGAYELTSGLLRVMVRGRDLPAREGLAWPGLNWPVSGNIDGEVLIEGPVTDLQYSINLDARDGELFAQEFQRLSSEIVYAQGVTTVRNLNVYKLEGDFVGNGSISADNFDLVFSTNNLPIPTVVAGLQRWLTEQGDTEQGGEKNPVLLILEQLSPQGSLKGGVKITGDEAHPKLQGEFTLSEVEVAGAPAGEWQVGLNGPIDDSGPSQPWSLQAEAVVAGGKVTTSGNLRLETGGPQLELQGQMQQVEMAPMVLLGQAITTALESAVIQDATWLPKLAAGSNADGSWRLQVDSSDPRGGDLSVDMNLSGDVSGIPYEAAVVGGGWHDEVVFERVKVVAAGGSASFSGHYRLGSVQIDGDWQNLPAALVGELANVAPPLAGDLQGELHLTTVEGNVQAVLAWFSDRLAVGESYLTDLSGIAVVDDSMVYLENWRGQAAERQVKLEGKVPLPLGFGNSQGSPVTADEIDLVIDIPDGPMQPLVAWLPLIPSLQGAGDYLQEIKGIGRVGVHIQGKPGNLTINGEANLSSGEAVLPAPFGRVNDLKAEVAFDGTEVRLDEISARLLGGRWHADGVISLQPDLSAATPAMALTLTGRGVRPELPGMKGDLDLDLQVLGAWQTPIITGDVNVKQAEVEATRTELPQGAAPGGLAIDPQLDVRLSGRRLHVKAAALLDVMAKGDLQLAGTASRPTLSGQLVAERGHFNYLGTFFDLEDASASFSPFNGINPSLQLRGSTWLGRYAIDLYMGGVYPNLEARLISDPPLSQQEIVNLLEWPGQISRLQADGSGSFGKGLFDILQGGVQIGLVGGVEDAIRQGLDLDYFRLEPDLAQRSLRISLGKYLLPRVYVTYGRSLFAQPEDELRLEYQFDDGWKVSGGLGEGGDVSMGLELKTRF